MARGWESKSVEEQQAEASQEKSAHAQLTREQQKARQQMEGLKLSHTRVAAQLAAAQSERHRQQLQAALDELERQIAALSA